MQPTARTGKPSSFNVTTLTGTQSPHLTSASDATSEGRSNHDQSVSPRSPGRVSRRLLERFALVAFALYHLPLLLNNYPSLGGGGMAEDGLAVRWGHVFTPIGMWAARYVLHLSGPMPNGYRGDNGDVGEEYGRLLVAVVVAVTVAVWWTVADRRRPRGRWVSEALPLLLRYSIVLGLTSYAIAKIARVQFPALDAITLDQRVGDLTPMSLLWSFMRYSRAYSMFGGVMELLVVLLLCFRRTASLGALLGLAVMTNVALLNYAYGVPVKLYSTMIVLSAAVLAVYDWPRLSAVFLKNEPVGATPTASRIDDRVPPWLRWTGKVALVGSVMVSSFLSMGPAAAVENTAASALDGAWTVTSFATGATSAIDPSAWRRLTVRGSTVAIRLTNDSTIYCRSSTSPSGDTLKLGCMQGRTAALHWSVAANRLQLEGAFTGAPVSATARRLAGEDYRLRRAKFRWMDD